jgi:hypothetical protein
MDAEHFLGRVAIQRGYASAKDILECLKVQVLADAVLEKHFYLGEILFLRGLITETHYRALMKAVSFAASATHKMAPQLFEVSPPARSEPAPTAPAAPPRRPLLGEALIARGLATPEQILHALDRQRADDALGAPHRRLGEILVAEEVVSQEALDETIAMVLEHRPPPPATGAQRD